MITKMNYLLLSTMMVAAIDSTFCRGCDCCKKLCEDKGSSGPFINSENNKIIMNEQVIKRNEEENKIDTNEGGEDEKKEILYFKIDEAGKDENIKKCFNETWYNKRQGKVLSLQKVKENGSGVLSVTCSGNNWEITNSKGDKFNDDNCDSDDNKWIIVEVLTLQEGSEGAWDSFIFYVDDITSFAGTGVFEEIECYSIDILAANTSAVENMGSMFCQVTSALEKDMKKDAGPGLIGLDKLNVENVTGMSFMFYRTIHKQATLDQLKKWRFSGENDVCIAALFASQVEGLNFTVLDDWNNTTHGEIVPFLRGGLNPETVFVDSNEYKFTAPRWYGDINKVV